MRRVLQLTAVLLLCLLVPAGVSWLILDVVEQRLYPAPAPQHADSGPDLLPQPGDRRVTWETVTPVSSSDESPALYYVGGYIHKDLCDDRGRPLDYHDPSLVTVDVTETRTSVTIAAWYAKRGAGRGDGMPVPISVASSACNILLETGTLWRRLVRLDHPIGDRRLLDPACHCNEGAVIRSHDRTKSDTGSFYWQSPSAPRK